MMQTLFLFSTTSLREKSKESKDFPVQGMSMGTQESPLLALSPLPTKLYMKEQEIGQRDKQCPFHLCCAIHFSSVLALYVLLSQRNHSTANCWSVMKESISTLLLYFATPILQLFPWTLSFQKPLPSLKYFE